MLRWSFSWHTVGGITIRIRTIHTEIQRNQITVHEYTHIKTVNGWIYIWMLRNIRTKWMKTVKYSIKMMWSLIIIFFFVLRSRIMMMSKSAIDGIFCCWFYLKLLLMNLDSCFVFGFCFKSKNHVKFAIKHTVKKIPCRLLAHLKTFICHIRNDTYIVHSS